VRYVPGSASLDKLLEQFSSAGVKLGLVVDEHGAVIGIVSTENIVQRLIVELTSDEELELESQVQQIGDARWSVPGRLTVRDWAAMFGLVGGTVEARVSTVGGLIFAKLGRVPRIGDVVTVGNLRLEVLSMVAPADGRGVGRVVESAAVSLVGKESEKRKTKGENEKSGGEA
jgi:CBS domain containing-hemolysin-like protein